MLGCRLVVWVMGDGDFSFLARMPPISKGVTARITLNGKVCLVFGVGIKVVMISIY